MFEHLPDMAAKRAELTPDAVAFVEAETARRWSFADINTAADRLGAGLETLGLHRGERLAILTWNRVEFFIALFACQKTGIILAPLNWRQPVAELLPVVESVGASAILFDAENAESGRALAARANLKRLAIGGAQQGEAAVEALMEKDAAAYTAAVSATEPWYLLFTSGTTGLPKAVVQTARMCWANTVNIGQAVDLVSSDRSINFLPLFHTAGINLYTMPLFLHGGSSIIVKRFEPATILGLIGAEKITQFFGVPAIFQAFSLHPDVESVDWNDVRCACGGAPLPEPHIRFFAERGAMICNGFGMTETGPTAFVVDRAHAVEKIGSVGRPQSLTEVRLDGIEPGAPGTGEVLLRGPAITPGYFENHDATSAAFTEDGWLRSGDIARRDADGYYFIVDRIKDMFISGGENVYPAE
ncbi:MAG: AMP-binding protein, partial [Rhodobiaceae bacterium]|nr:AMP-binding protein [Rhodobiaceae bacterium]